ncbi:MAG: M48 family metalloprotease [Bacteroidetes bacterium]|jgi:STE24 endopeptidase|nr:M48 family metalloprotease [Bacteroidota bacterium]
MNTALFGITAVLLIDIVLRTFLIYLNISWLKNPMPEELTGVYSYEAYRNSQEYQHSTLQLLLIYQLAVFVLVMVMIYCGVIRSVDQFFRSFFASEYALGVAFFIVIGFLFQLVRFIFEMYQQLVINNRFGFNKTGVQVLKEFFVKGLLALFFGSLAYWFLMFSFNWLGAQFWIASWVLFGGVYLLYNFINQRIIANIFNRNYEPLLGELRDEILLHLKQYGISATAIIVRKNTLSQDIQPASIVGWGSGFRVILSESAIKLLDIKEVMAVITHEVTHKKRNHLPELLFSNLLQLGLLLLLLWFSLSQVFLQQAFGELPNSMHLGLLVFVLLFSPLALFINALLNSISRYFERQADLGAKRAGLADELVSAIRKLAAENLDNLTPHPAYVVFYYSHPGLAERIKYLKA